MTKSRALGPKFDSVKQKKIKPGLDEITDVQEVNDKKKKKKRKSDDEKSQGCEHTGNISEENAQMRRSTETHEENAEICKHKSKKRKTKTCVCAEDITEKPQDSEQILDTTRGREDHTRNKKRKHKDPLVDLVRPLEDENNTQTSEVNNGKRQKKSKSGVPETNSYTNGHHEENTQKKKKKSKACVPVEDITEEPQNCEQPENMTHGPEDHTKKKKRKHKDSEENVPKSNLVNTKGARDETNTQTTEEKAEMKRKGRKSESSGDASTSLKREHSGVEDEEGTNEEEELGPEEIRVLERKMKKIRKKEENKKLREEGKSTKTENVMTNIAEKQALEYLTCWSERKEEWRFQKTRQTWLLQHMYDDVKVPDAHFELLLSYLEGLFGAARATTLQKAEALVRWEGQGKEEDTADNEKRKERARQVIQML
ncbi:uncharacterized protein C7orf50 homolog [Xyrauchen texanus]|uniref:uncharacterized protein C7orf50 homolog n=1 Tax=Xyrauchen texanus TaxID=154827 RepID=UPI0022428933|nr:uncharacterized protein C7orf50 homolog [Xyrauchen texanus]